MTVIQSPCLQSLHTFFFNLKYPFWYSWFIWLISKQTTQSWPLCIQLSTTVKTWKFAENWNWFLVTSHFHTFSLIIYEPIYATSIFFSKKTNFSHNNSCVCRGEELYFSASGILNPRPGCLGFFFRSGRDQTQVSSNRLSPDLLISWQSAWQLSPFHPLTFSSIGRSRTRATVCDRDITENQIKYSLYRIRTETNCWNGQNSSVFKIKWENMVMSLHTEISKSHFK